MPELHFNRASRTVDRPQVADDDNEARRLISALSSFKIDVQVLERHVGPRTVTYRVMPAPGVTVSTIIRRALDVGVQLGTPCCTAREEQGKMFVEIGRDDADIPLLTSLPLSECIEDVLLGMDALGEPAYIQVQKCPSAILAGSSGSGKSTALRVLIMGLLRNKRNRLVVCDPKGSREFNHLVTGRDAAHRLAADAHETRDWVYVMGEVLHARIGLKRLREVSAEARKFDDGRIVLIIDEVQALDSEHVRRVLNQILALGRSNDMHVFLATQHPSAAVLGNDMRVNCPTRFVLRVASQSDSRVALGENGAERLLGTGDGLLKYDGRLTRIQVPSLG